MKQDIASLWHAIKSSSLEFLTPASRGPRRHGGRSGKSARKREPVPHLSGASKCVWQQDREA